MNENAAKKVAIRESLVYEAVDEGSLNRIDQLDRFLIETSKKVPDNNSHVMRRSLTLQERCVLLRLLDKRSHEVLHKSNQQTWNVCTAEEQNGPLQDYRASGSSDTPGSACSSLCCFGTALLARESVSLSTMGRIECRKVPSS